MDLVIGKEAVFGTVSQAVSDFTGAITEGLGDTISGALGWLAGVTLALVVSVAILIATFKIFFELLKTYVSVVISIATAPLLLMLGAMPGQNNFFKWIKGIAGNLMAFPMVLMAFIIYDMFTRNSGAEGGFLPPFLPGRGSTNAIITLVGIGVLLVIPDLIKEIKKLFGAEGGIWETLAGKAATALKTDGLRYAVPLGYLGTGAVGDVYRGIRDKRGQGTEAILSKVWENLRTNAPTNLKRGNETARGIENIIEGKLVDPTNIEYILQRGLVSEQREREKKARDEREKRRVVTTG
jgi:hypothetical protein